MSAVLIWKLLKVLLSLKPNPLLNRFPENVAMPVGVVLGPEARQLNAPKVAVTYNQYLVPAVNVRGPVGVKV